MLNDLDEILLLRDGVSCGGGGDDLNVVAMFCNVDDFGVVGTSISNGCIRGVATFITPREGRCLSPSFCKGILERFKVRGGDLLLLLLMMILTANLRMYGVRCWL